MTALDNLHHQLIPQTISHALEIPFYRRLWREASTLRLDALSGANATRALSELPTFTKAVYREAEAADRRRTDLTPASIAHSTGTSGTPLIRVRSREELDAYQRLVSGRRARVSPARSLMFSALAPSIHGGRTGLKLADIELAISTATLPVLDRAIDLILDPRLGADVPDRRVLTGSPQDLKIITARMRERRDDLTKVTLHRLVTVSDVTTAPYLNWLRAMWPNSAIVNRFSMSEVIGGATELPDRSLRFDPSIVAQVVELDSDAEVSNGIGELVLTELYPFSQIQPFVRYRTGDLVEVLGAIDGQPQISFMGRIGTTPLAKAGTRVAPLVSMVRLRAILDSTPSLAKEEIGPDGARYGLGDSYGAWTLAHSETGQPIFLLSVQPSFEPSLFPTEAGLLREQLARQVCTEVTRTAPDANVSIEVNLLSRGHLPTLGSRLSVWRDQADVREGTVHVNAK